MITSFQAPSPSRADPHPGRVLVVDDEPAVRRLVVTLLASRGHQATPAGGTEEALGLLAAGDYDVVLLDLEMPGRGGLDLLGQLPATGSDAVPVLLTGTHDVGVAVAAMKCGAFDYLPKPVDSEVLGWTVARAVQVARTRRREKALESVVAEWASTFDACPDMLLILDAGGRVLRANEAVSRRLGGGPDAAVGRTADALFPGGLGAAITKSLPGGAAGTPGNRRARSTRPSADISS